jgi:hypothetical protein
VRARVLRIAAVPTEARSGVCQAFLMRLTSDTYMQNCELRSYRLSGGRWTRDDRFSITNTLLNLLPGAT